MKDQISSPSSRDLSANINHLKYIQIVENCSRRFTDLDQAIQFMKDQESKLKGGFERAGALLLCKISQADKRLSQGNYNDCFDLLEEIENTLKSLPDVDRVVYSFLYKVMALYYRRKEKFTDFYQAGLQFLAYTPDSELTEQERKEWSVNMGMAVLLGKDIYNIAELCEKETLKALIGTEQEWLYNILMTLDSGDIQKFEQVC
jgi:hypothetical protein